MTPTPRILLDLPPEQEQPLFAADLLDRLAALGQVERGRNTAWAGDARMAADVLVTGWGSERLPTRRRPGDRLALVMHSAGTVRPVVPVELIVDGVRVSQATGAMARSVAEMALFFTLSLLRDLHRVERRMQAGDWAGAQGVGLGSTVDTTRIGVVAASRVGRIYIELVRALGAEVVVHDPYLSGEDAARLGVTRADLDEVFASCRVVALHAPVTDETRGFVDARRLALLADGAVLVNTARAAVLDSQALERELVSGRISAALDVFDVEPLPPQSALWSLPNVVLTPHLGAVTHQSRRQQGETVVDEIERFVAGEPLLAEVRAESYERLA